MTWTEGLDNGGAPVLDYAIWSDQATDTWVMLAQGLTVYEYTATNLSPGLVYKF